MKGVFITGTDTGVGKTHVATHIARALTLQGIRVVPRKPVESGCTRVNNELVPADALILKNAANFSGTLQQVCPYPFEPAISPARAAKLANKTLHIADLKAACISGIQEKDYLLVEGAGGFYSPLCSDGLNADLAHALALPIILVAEDRVGCINHILLTLEAAAKRKLEIKAIILNQKTNTTADMDNATELSQYIQYQIFNFPSQNDILLRSIL
jgi:dethiobiotin synthetase